MDIKKNITRKKEVKKEEPKAKTIFSLSMEVQELPATKDEENYNFKGKVHADKMDSDLMASILAHLIKESVPANAVEEVLNLTADKLGFVDVREEDEECNCESCKPKAIHIQKQTIDKDNIDSFIGFLKHILGE